MSYDADPGMRLNYGQILDNFHTQGGVAKAIINIGFEPGNQVTLTLTLTLTLNPNRNPNSNH